MSHLGQCMWEAVKKPAALQAVIVVQPLSDSINVHAVRHEAPSLQDGLQGLIACRGLGLQQGPDLDVGQPQAV